MFFSYAFIDSQNIWFLVSLLVVFFALIHNILETTGKAININELLSFSSAFFSLVAYIIQWELSKKNWHCLPKIIYMIVPIYPV